MAFPPVDHHLTSSSHVCLVVCHIVVFVIHLLDISICLASLLHIVVLRGRIIWTTHRHRHRWHEWVLAWHLRIWLLLLIVIMGILHAVGEHKWLQVILVGHATNVATALCRWGLEDVETRRGSILLLDLSRRGSCIDLVCVLHSLILASTSSDSLKLLDLEDASAVCWTNIFSGPFAVLFELFVHVE